MSSRSHRRPEPCGEENCGSRRFHVGDDGYTYCDQGHQQSHVSANNRVYIHLRFFFFCYTWPLTNRIIAWHGHRRRYRRTHYPWQKTTPSRLGRRIICSKSLTRLHWVSSHRKLPPRLTASPEEAGLMAHNSRETPHSSRSALVPYPMSTLHHKTTVDVLDISSPNVFTATRHF